MLHQNFLSRWLVFFSAEEEEDDDQPTSSSSARTVIAPKDDTPTSSTEPLPPGIQEPPAVEIVKVEPAVRYQAPVTVGYQPQPYLRPHQRFHPYGGQRKPFDFNRIGGTGCILVMDCFNVTLHAGLKFQQIAF